MCLGNTEFQSERNGPGETDLASVGMAAQQQIEIGMRSLAVDLRRMGKENGKLGMRELRRGFFDIIDAIVVGVVDPRHMDALIAANDRRGFVEQHSDAHFFHAGHHADRIVVFPGHRKRDP